MADVSVNQLHAMVLREAESDTVLEMDINMYQNISEFIGRLRRQEFDGMENKMRDSLVSTITSLTDILLRTRLQKASRPNSPDIGNLLDEEKYVLDAEEERQERVALVSGAIQVGQTQRLRRVSEWYKSRKVTVRFLDGVEALTGADYESYGPFKQEDVGTIPYVNARSLITQGSAVRVRWID